MFISYRRGDSGGHTGRLYDGLSAAFGDTAVFMDIDTIDPGVDFAKRIREALTTCRIVLVVIGPRWLTASKDDGTRRLDDPDDYLRMEIAASLQRDNALVIPILVAGADVPTREQLPEPLRPLALRQAIEISDPRWNFDLARLEGVIRRAMARRPDSAPPPERRDPPTPPVDVAGGGRGRGAGGDDGHGSDGGSDDEGRPSPGPDGQHGSRFEWERQRSSTVLLAIVLVVLLAGGGWWWYRSQVFPPYQGGGSGPTEAASADDASSGPPAVATESGEPAEPSQSETAAPEPRPDIAFVRNGELWGVDRDGENHQAFTDLPLEVQHPDWAKDGRMVFSSTRDEGDFQVGDTEIWVAEPNGDQHQLTNNRVNDATPDWSPDGRRIAYSSSPDDKLRDIFVMQDDGDNPVNLTNTLAMDDDTPEWSPDGAQIVWEREIDGQHDIWRMDAGGDNPTAITDTPEIDDYWPAWSPDGDRIAFRSNALAEGSREYDIFTVDVDSGPADAAGYTQITTDGQNNHRPAWSPDGTWIAFDKARNFSEARAARDNDAIDNDRDVWIKPVAGGMSEWLTNRTGTNVAPVWRPEN